MKAGLQITVPIKLQSLFGMPCYDDVAPEIKSCWRFDLDRKKLKNMSQKGIDLVHFVVFMTIGGCNLT